MPDDLTGLPLTPVDDGGDLADHEAAFGPNGTGDVPEATHESDLKDAQSGEASPDAAAAAQAARDDAGRFKKTPRHRAQSQKASPRDVPRIQELSARLKAVEAERDALKARPSPVPSPATQAPPPASAAGSSAPPRSERVDPPPTRAKPTEDDIGTKYASYGDYTEALADWVVEQREAKRDAKQQQEQHQKTYGDRLTVYQTNQQAAKAKYADYDAVLQAANQAVQPTQVVLEAIFASDRNADIEYWLGTHLDDYRQIVAESQPINTPSAVNFVKSVLESRLPPVASGQRSPREAAGSTGAAPTLSVVPAPRPPTPVRTGPLKIGDDPPDDEDSLDAHEAYFHRKSR